MFIYLFKWVAINLNLWYLKHVKEVGIMVVVFKASENVKKKLIEYYEPYRKAKTPPYAVFQAQDFDTVVTLYESGKVMFQGADADMAASIWIEQERVLNNRIISLDGKDKSKKDKEDVKKFYNMSTIGSDEVGTGDYFGPIVVSATYVSKENIPFLIDLGVRDSKKLTDEKMIEIAPKIIEKIPYVTFILDNSSYNKLSDTDKNMNKIKAVLHNKVLVNLIKKGPFDYEKIVIDQFVYPKKFYEHISRAPEKITNVTFLTKSEDQVMSVAAASIISRYIFLSEMKKMSEKLGKTVPLGASNVVDDFACEMVKKYGMNVLTSCTKLNFKNTEKVKNLLS